MPLNSEMRSFSLRLSLIFLSCAAFSMAAPSRITKPIDPSHTAVVSGHVHRLAQAQFDRGAVDAAKQLNYVVLLVKPSAAQQSDLENLLADQQNPSSPNFRKWLTPEQFGNRFGLSSSDESKIVAWLTSQGFSIDHRARSANWIAFSGTASQVSAALNTPIHQFEVNGAMHFANTAVPSVPEALSDVVAGFLGLNDFHPQSGSKPVTPDYTSGSNHYLTPADYSTIYDISPLYSSGIDGTGQSIAVVGESDVLVSDITKFRSTFGLPVNSPRMYLYGTTDPGYNGAQFEGNIDLEWAGAVAPKATLYYIYGPDAFTAIVAAVELDYAPVITASYSTCEVDADPVYYRAIAQQGNAQGITILAASGDAGAAACDFQASEPYATRGLAVNFPAVLPEVTGVGGTQFAEGSGNYWSATNSSTDGSALSYIPEAAWNESSSTGLGSTGGGASIFYSKPVWQTGPGVPNDNARDVPDVALTSAIHDGYYVTYDGVFYISGGTSCATPSMAAMVALLNQYQVTNKYQTTPGLGNINPQLYRLAQSAPAAFHDVATGNNIVACAQGTPNCLTGSFGYNAAAAYDQTTGLGSVDANLLLTSWNTAAKGSVVTLTASATRATLNNTIQLTATVTPATGAGTPTGTVSFVSESTPIGNAPLVNGTATVPLPLYEIGYTGLVPVAVQYSGDASFSAGGAAKTIAVTLPSGVTSIIPSAPTTVWANPPDAAGLNWQTTITLTEVAGVPAMVTGLTIDGVAQSLSQYFPSPDIPANGTVNVNFVFRNLAAPVTRTFVFTGNDPTGLVWTRQVAVNYMPVPEFENFNVSATPLTAVQNTASTSCPWSVQLNVDETGGYGGHVITGLYSGGPDISSNIDSIFGTTRLDAWAGVQGTLCYTGVTAPSTDQVAVILDNSAEIILNVSFAAPPAHPGTLATAPAMVTLTAPNAATPGTASLAVNLSDQTQQWSASVYPANITTSWLSASQLSGNGSGTITLTANGTGFEPGVYRATIVFQSQNAIPQYINVPVMFTLGGSTTGTAITAVANSASYQTAVSPGMLLSVFGTKLANTTVVNSGNPLPYSIAGVSASVNGLAAPIVYASPTMLNIQVPYEVGAGPAVIGVNNNGQVAGFHFEMSPASPGVYADANGNVLPIPVVTAGSAVALYVTGTGDVTPALNTAFSPPTGTSLANLPLPVLPLSVTVGGVAAYIEFAGISPGLIGVTQVNILVPASTPVGNQPVVVTVNGVASAPVNIVVQPRG